MGRYDSRADRSVLPQAPCRASTNALLFSTTLEFNTMRGSAVRHARLGSPRVLCPRNGRSAPFLRWPDAAPMLDKLGKTRPDVATIATEPAGLGLGAPPEGPSLRTMRDMSAGQLTTTES
jgi:hypothetical protein